MATFDPGALNPLTRLWQLLQPKKARQKLLIAREIRNLPQIRASSDSLWYQARQYRLGFPGIDPLFYRLTIFRLLDGERGLSSVALIRYMACALYHRTSIARRATWFGDYLNIAFPNCGHVDADEALGSFFSNEETDLAGYLEEIEGLVIGRSTKLFEDPEVFRDYPFVKLVSYMTLVSYSTRWGIDLIEAEIGRLTEATQHPIFRNKSLHSAIGFKSLANRPKRRRYRESRPDFEDSRSSCGELSFFLYIPGTEPNSKAPRPFLEPCRCFESRRSKYIIWDIG